MSMKKVVILGCLVILACTIFWPVYLVLLILYLRSSEQDVQQFSFKFGNLNVSYNNSQDNSDSKVDMIDPLIKDRTDKPTIQELRKLIEYHNYNLARFFKTRDKDYLQETISSNFSNSSESYFNEIFENMQQTNWESCHIVTLHVKEPTFVSDHRLIVLTDEEWIYIYSGGKISQTQSVQKYTIVEEKHRWLIESCDFVVR